MKKALCLFLLVSTYFSQAQLYSAKSGLTMVSFFSKASLEDIEATNKGNTAVFLKITTGDIQMSISMLGFKFKNALMEEHFNENYIESEKYPNCIFKGKINEPGDYSVDGEYKVTITGQMDMHGVTNEVTIPGTLQKTGNEIKLSSKFKIKVADYKIKVPSMYVSNIAEEVDVTFTSVLVPFQKK